MAPLSSKPQWENLAIALNFSLPSPYSAAMTFDPALGEMVLFGGGPEPNGVSNLTYVYKNQVWSQLQTKGPAPPARYAAGLAYDSADGYLVLFGGINGNLGMLKDTWILENDTWSKVNLNGPAPSPRGFFGMDYDAAGGFVLLYGGILQGGISDTNDTWEFRAGQWTEVFPTLAPPARDEPGMAFDPALGGSVLFGGTYEKADTWLFKGGQWTEFYTPYPHPEGRYGPSLAYDYADGELVLWGGQNWSTGVQYGDNWVFNGTNWTEFYPSADPSTGPELSMAYDFSDGYLLFTAGSLVSDTWAFKGAEAHGFTNVSSGSTSPSPREGAAFSYDEHDGYSVLFGGFGPAPRGDTWIFKNGSWTELHPTGAVPSARGGATMVYDPAESAVVMFGGADGSKIFNDLWEFQSGTWSNITPSGTLPTPRTQAAFAYDYADGSLLLFGGNGNSGPLNDTWTFNSSGWNQADQSGPAPPPLTGASATFDASDGYILLAGGVTAGGPSTSTWEYTGNQWSVIPTKGCLPAFGAATLAYDQRNGLVIEYGDSASGGQTAFFYEDGYWFCSQIPLPSARTGGSMTFDESTGALILFGGFQPSGRIYLNDTWALGSVLDTALVPLSSSADAGQEIGLEAIACGGFPNFVFNFSSGPPGCRGGSDYPTNWCQVGTAGTYNVTATINDSQGLHATATIASYTVYPDPVVGTPVASRPSADVGQTVSFHFNASLGTAVFTNYSWTGLPTSDCSGTWSAAAACTLVTPGTLTLSGRVVDSNGIAEQSTSPLDFEVNTDPTIDAPLANRTLTDLGQEVNFVVAPTGGSGSYDVSWQVPAGVTCYGTHGLTTACVFAASGAYSISAVVVDSNGVSFDGPSTAIDIYSPPVAGTPILSNDSVDTNESVLVLANVTGGAPPETITWYGLPASCTGTYGPTLSCSSSAPGNFSISYTVLDGAGVLSHASVTVLQVHKHQSSGTSPPPPPAKPTSSFPSDAWLTIFLVLGAIVGALAGYLVRRRIDGASVRPDTPK